MKLDPAIYHGELRHRRFRPTRHTFSYPVFMAFLDIDTIPETMARARFAAYNRFQWAAFHERDHLGDPRLPLRERLRQDAAAQGLTLPEGPAYLLTNLRYLGYCFNPVSFYFCYDAAGGPPRVLAEVNNTFGEARHYWLGPHNAAPSANALRYRCGKDLHVSPFMEMNLEYDFVLTHPGDRLVIHMNTLKEGASFFDATLRLVREPWNSANLTRALLRQPWMTAKVTAAIHWEALRLWWKGTPVYTHPERQEAARQ